MRSEYHSSEKKVTPITELSGLVKADTECLNRASILSKPSFVSSENSANKHINMSGEKAMMNHDRQYGCNCGPSKNKDKMYCMRVEQWLKVLFPAEKFEEMSFADVGKDRSSATFAQL